MIENCLVFVIGLSNSKAGRTNSMKKEFEYRGYVIKLNHYPLEDGGYAPNGYIEKTTDAGVFSKNIFDSSDLLCSSKEKADEMICYIAKSLIDNNHIDF